MSWARRWRIDSQEKWRRTLTALLSWTIDFSRNPVEVLVRTEFQEKSDSQRALFHAVCADIGTQVGLTPGQTKQAVKESYFGTEVITIAGRRYEFIRSSEELDREHYSELIDHTYLWGAEAGAVVVDRRAK